MPESDPLGKKEPGTVGLEHPTIIMLKDGEQKSLIPVISIIITNEGAVDIMVYKVDASKSEATVLPQKE